MAIQHGCKATDANKFEAYVGRRGLVRHQIVEVIVIKQFSFVYACTVQMLQYYKSVLPLTLLGIRIKLLGYSDYLT